MVNFCQFSDTGTANHSLYSSNLLLNITSVSCRKIIPVVQSLSHNT